MPAKNSRKIYIKDGYYHTYNRGVEKRDIYLDDQDYTVFLHLLKYYLSPPPENENKHPLKNLPDIKIVRPRPLKNLNNEIELMAFCLMPNHYHLLIKQNSIDGMQKLIRNLTTIYSMYFNKRYDRVGYLFQGRYKAVMITKDSYLLHLSRYIHLNPVGLTGPHPVNYPYSSYLYYLNKKRAGWIKPDFILKYFNKNKLLPDLLSYPSYQEFVEAYPTAPEDVLGDLILD
jgi:putative transposase